MSWSLASTSRKQSYCKYTRAKKSFSHGLHCIFVITDLNFVFVLNTMSFIISSSWRSWRIVRTLRLLPTLFSPVDSDILPFILLFGRQKLKIRSYIIINNSCIYQSTVFFIFITKLLLEYVEYCVINLIPLSLWNRHHSVYILVTWYIHAHGYRCRSLVSTMEKSHSSSKNI